MLTCVCHCWTLCLRWSFSSVCEQIHIKSLPRCPTNLQVSGHTWRLQVHIKCSSPQKAGFSPPPSFIAALRAMRVPSKCLVFRSRCSCMHKRAEFWIRIHQEEKHLYFLQVAGDSCTHQSRAHWSTEWEKQERMYSYWLKITSFQKNFGILSP